MVQAEKKLKGNFFFKDEERFEEAAELFEKAANQFKILLQWQEAAQAYRKVASSHRLSEQKYSEANAYMSAAQCFAKSDVAQAIDCYKEASLAWQEDGKFINAGKAFENVAQLYEKNGDLELAVEQYLQAVHICQCENNAERVTRSCLIKAALLSAQSKQFDQAIKIYEKLANQSVDDRALRFQVPDFLLNASLCNLARDDIVAAQRNIANYLEQDAYFAAHRDGKFVCTLLDAILQNNLVSFNQAIVEYDAITRLDPVRVTLLLHIKKILNPEEKKDKLPVQLDDIHDNSDVSDSDGLQ